MHPRSALGATAGLAAALFANVAAAGGWAGDVRSKLRAESCHESGPKFTAAVEACRIGPWPQTCLGLCVGDLPPGIGSSAALCRTNGATEECCVQARLWPPGPLHAYITNPPVSDEAGGRCAFQRPDEALVACDLGDASSTATYGDARHRSTDACGTLCPEEAR